MNHPRKSVLFAGIAALVLVGVVTPAYAADTAPDLNEVDADLQGMVLVMGGEVYGEGLEPVADVYEYEDAFEEAGYPVSDAQIEATIPGDEILVAPDEPTGFGAGIGVPVKMETPGCSGQDQLRNLQTMTRGGKSGVVARGIAYRMCGNSAWGWRHIAIRHTAEWSKIGQLFGRSWNDFATWAIYGISGSPSNIAYAPINDTYIYTAPVQLWKNGRLITTYNPKVVISNKTWRIITAYPTRP